MSHYNLVVENPESTVVSEYQPLVRKEASYQSEAALEKSLIEQLKMQAYEYLPFTSEQQLIGNLRTQLEKLNDYTFTDNEWSEFFDSKIANKNYDIEDKTAIIQEDHIQLLTRADGSIKNIYLIDKDNIHNNRLQVINQYSDDDESQHPVSEGIAGQARNDGEGGALDGKGVAAIMVRISH